MADFRALWRHCKRELKAGFRLYSRVERPCNLCGGHSNAEWAYNRLFHKCSSCGFIFTDDYRREDVAKGMGMEGSWSGPGTGGYREYWLSMHLTRELDKKRILLFGTGNTRTLEKLLDEGYDVVGCDISETVVSYKKKTLGNDRFCMPHELHDEDYDAIVAVEVFEHFTNPALSLKLLFSKLRKEGVICGTTNFYPGRGPIEDSNEPGYMSLNGHVAYWSERCMTQAVKPFGYKVATFQMVRPGSVLPDEKFKQLWPNKRVFFLYDPDRLQDFFSNLLEQLPILPIDRA